MQEVQMHGFRLSPQQGHLWSWQQVSGNVLSVHMLVEIEGPLKVHLLQQALEDVIERHDILRSTFQQVPGMALPIQIINEHPTHYLNWQEEHLENASFAQQQEFLSQCLKHQPFNLENGRLVDVLLVHIGEQRCLWLLRLSALCADSQTLYILLKQVRESYAESIRMGGIAWPREEEALRYVDVAEWLHDQLASEEGQNVHDHWQQQKLEQSEQISTLFRRPLTGTSEWLYQRQQLVLEGTTRAALEKIGQRMDVPLHTILLACWQIVLWRFNAEMDPSLSVLVNGRSYEELAEVFGPLARYLPLSASLDRQMLCHIVMTRLHSHLQQIEKWPHFFPWQAEDQALQAQVGFAFEEWPSPTESAGLRFQVLEQQTLYEPFVIHLGVANTVQGLQVTLSYNAECIDAWLVKQLGQSWVCLLQAVIENVEVPIVSLPAVSTSQRAFLLNKFNPPVQPLPQTLLLHRRFEQQVERTPTEQAVVCDEESLTYTQLNRLANQLAYALRARGVKQGELVGLCMPRSVQAIVGLFGILKSGGVAVLLDPEQPPQRLQSQLSQSRARLLVTQVFLEQVLAQDTQQSQDNFPVYLQEAERVHDLAYVIYTSGSTGNPKGVAIEHRSLLNYVQAIQERIRWQPGWHGASVSTLVADLGYTVVFPTLFSGGCLHLIPQKWWLDAPALAAYLQAHPIDVLKIVPSHLQALLHGDEGKALLPREALLMGGEALPWSLVEELEALGGSCRLYNHYGPTETTVGVLVNSLDESPLPINERIGIVPIGTPLSNCELYLLDEQAELVPPGAPGEIFIGGAGLARGYLYQDEMTRERFVAHPFCAGARLYRTGDRGRLNHDEQVEFLGRLDEQVKLRGHRIELGEIAAALRNDSQVKEVLVLLREDLANEPRLVGYIVPRKQETIDINKLRESLRERLPEVMVPTALISLPALPLTSNGKVDRRQLPAPTSADMSTTKTMVAAQTPLEELLMSIWQEVLGLPQISRDDHFFALGGHSLLATQVVARVRQIVQREVPVRGLFEHPILCMFAAWVHQQEQGSIPPLKSVSLAEPLPLSFAQQRLWFLDRLKTEADNTTTYITMSSVKLQGELDKVVLAKSIQEIVVRHAILRTTFALQEGQPVQIIAPTLSISLPVITIDQKREEAVQQWIKQEAYIPFDLGKGPLLRVNLLQLAEQEFILVLTLHHIVSDAWTKGILIRELSALYTAFVQGQPSPLPPLVIQYADVAVWQRNWLQGEVLERLLDYWRLQLAGATPLELPADFPRMAHTSNQGANYPFQLSTDVTRALKQLGQEEDVTLFMLLLAAFQLVLAQYCEKEDIVVGTDIANRTMQEMEGLVGFFVNLLVLRARLTKKMRVRELLQQVRETVLAAYGHQDIPFEKLVEALRLERAANQTPLVQVLFVLQNAPRAVLELPGLTMTPMPLQAETAKFDLAVFLREEEGEIKGTFTYRTDLFKEERIGKLVSQYEQAIGRIITQLDVQLGMLDLFSEDEKQHMLIQEQKQDAFNLKKLETLRGKGISLVPNSPHLEE